MENSIENIIGQRIAKYRDSRELTQAELAEMIEVAPETISRMERGISIPSIKTLEKIAHVLQVRIVDFFTNELVPKKSNKRDSEISKILVFLQNKEIGEIRLALKMIKSLFSGIKENYRPLKN